MQFDMRSLPLMTRYKIANSTVTPRPIAWITSMSLDGVVNAAPYSFFNVVGADPVLIALGLIKSVADRTLKNTASNIIACSDFVVNLVSEHDAEKMNQSSVDAPSDVSEVEYASLETVPSVLVAPPRIATSPVSFECRKVVALDVGTLQTVVIAEVLMAHIRDEFISDVENVYIDTPAMKLIGRTHGNGWYARTSDQFQLERPIFDPQRLAQKVGQD